MQFKIPQDVQREDTIVGPLTLKQLIIVGAGGGLAYAIYVSLAKTYFMEIWLPPVAVVVAITAAFAFLKVHGLQFHVFLMSFLEYHILPKQRFWIQGTGTPFVPPFQEQKKDETPKENQIKKEEKSIDELTQILDSGGKKEALRKIINQNYNKQATQSPVPKK